MIHLRGRRNVVTTSSDHNLLHLEGVALINEVLLPLGRVVHLRRVRADQRVEEGVETAIHVSLKGRIQAQQHQQRQRRHGTALKVHHQRMCTSQTQVARRESNGNTPPIRTVLSRSQHKHAAIMKHAFVRFRASGGTFG